MMWLKKLTLLNFKNYTQAELDFSPTVNVLVGNNGAGKTNLLDAIHYLCLCKSYFNPIDSQQIKNGEDLFLVQGHFEKDETIENISCGLKRNQKKSFKRNKKEYEKLAEHIGLFPLVMVSPYDIGLIMDGSEERRRFIDNVISQTDARYLDQLIRYNKHLQSRNVLLKQAAVKSIDGALLQVLDEQLVQSGNIIFQKRQQFLADFIPLFDQHYQFLVSGEEEVSLRYSSQLAEKSFESLLTDAFDKDRLLERTTVGVHKDELQFEIKGMALKKFGSQGQQKSFLMALKLAQYSYLRQNKGYKPLLLLDDIFDKLDNNRIRKLMEMVSHEDFGQLFITDTHRDRIARIFEDICVDIKLFEVANGELSYA